MLRLCVSGTVLLIILYQIQENRELQRYKVSTFQYIRHTVRQMPKIKCVTYSFVLHYSIVNLQQTVGLFKHLLILNNIY